MKSLRKFLEPEEDAMVLDSENSWAFSKLLNTHLEIIVRRHHTDPGQAVSPKEQK